MPSQQEYRIDYGWTPCAKGMRVKGNITRVGKVLKDSSGAAIEVSGWTVDMDGADMVETPMPETAYDKTLGGHTVEELEKIADEHYA